MTDFGLYFVYFSFFLVVSALLLASLFFRLGVEQRLREIGAAARHRVSRDCHPPRCFWARGLVLSVLGSALGVLGAVLYAELIMLGTADLVGRCGRDDPVDPRRVAGNAGRRGGGRRPGRARVSIAWTLRALAPASPRSLLTGAVPEVTGAAEVAAPSMLAGTRAWRIGILLVGGGGRPGRGGCGSD